MDPVRLVADDIIGLTKTLKGLQSLLEVYEIWAIRNGLKSNLTKSQVLRVHPIDMEQTAEVKLDGVQLNCNFFDFVDYLELQLTRNCITGNCGAELLSKCTGSLHLMLNENGSHSHFARTTS